jgi:hypothetical protein
MFQVFHLFQTYVAIVSFGCFKSRSRGSTCCCSRATVGHRAAMGPRAHAAGAAVAACVHADARNKAGLV